MNRIVTYQKHLLPYWLSSHNVNTIPFGEIKKIWKKDINNNTIFSRVPLKDTYITEEGIIDDNNQYISKERAVLIQTMDNYTIINDNYPFIPNITPDKAGCGENIYVNGINTKNTYIGDIFKTNSGVLLQVTSPRKPCTRWTRKYKDQTLRLFILRNTLGGIFLKVLNPGKIIEGDKIYLYKRLQTKWSIKLVGDKLYSRHNDDIYDFECWSGDDNELYELYNLNELANRDWKNEIKRVIDEKNEY